MTNYTLGASVIDWQMGAIWERTPRINMCGGRQDGEETQMNIKAAATAALVMCASATFAQDKQPPAGVSAGPGGPPPPAVLATINMARAGMLTSYFSDAQFGIQQGRLGASRVRIGQVRAGNVSPEGIKEEGRSMILGLGASTVLPNGKSTLSLSLPVAVVDEAPNQISAEGSYPAFRASYQNFINPTTMIGGSVTYVDFEVRTYRPNGARVGRVQRESLDFRVDFLKKLSDHWGFVSRATYTVGDTTTTIFGPGLEQTQKEERYYLQADLVGNFRNQDLSMVPEGWVLHPGVGLSYLRAQLEETQNNFGIRRSGVYGDIEASGSVWAVADLVKEVRPGAGWSPSFKLGLEHVYKDDLSNYIDEKTYILGGIGASFTTKTGNRFQAGFETRQGVKGNRSQNTLVVAYGVTF